MKRSLTQLIGATLLATASAVFTPDNAFAQYNEKVARGDSIVEVFIANAPGCGYTRTTETAKHNYSCTDTQIGIRGGMEDYYLDIILDGRIIMEDRDQLMRAYTIRTTAHLLSPIGFHLDAEYKRTQLLRAREEELGLEHEQNVFYGSIGVQTNTGLADWSSLTVYGGPLLTKNDRANENTSIGFTTGLAGRLHVPTGDNIVWVQTDGRHSTTKHHTNWDLAIRAGVDFRDQENLILGLFLGYSLNDRIDTFIGGNTLGQRAHAFLLGLRLFGPAGTRSNNPFYL